MVHAPRAGARSCLASTMLHAHNAQVLDYKVVRLAACSPAVQRSSWMLTSHMVAPRASKIILPDFICVIHLIDNVTANATRYTNMICRCATAYSYCAAVLALIKVLVIIGISFGLRCGSALAYVSVIFVSRTRCCGAYRSKAYSYDIRIIIPPVQDIDK